MSILKVLSFLSYIKQCSKIHSRMFLYCAFIRAFQYNVNFAEKSQYSVGKDIDSRIPLIYLENQWEILD